MSENLNPEAVERTISKAYGNGPSMDWPFDLTGGLTRRAYARSHVEKIVSAYFAALPSPRPGTLIKTVEELDALPLGTSVVINGTMLQATDRDSYGTMWSRVCDIDAYQSDALDLPATVLWVPTEGGRDAT